MKSTSMKAEPLPLPATVARTPSTRIERERFFVNSAKIDLSVLDESGKPLCDTHLIVREDTKRNMVGSWTTLEAPPASRGPHEGQSSRRK